MKLKALAFATGMACVTLPAFAADQVASLSAGKAMGGAATGAGNDVPTLVNLDRTKGATAGEAAGTAAPEPQTYMLMLAGLGVIGLLFSRRRPH